ncbi:hypothetical protein [Jiella sonneratiae]|uniref:Uncharacterized protein n=1 Tax=Jiella sonneratiae TaxID=2816856 RepID=A0ABS3J0I5_9HYPH|nr:hypothetical protein [Jiella sonneratiae]MBO0902650.1 hypothetical protein [Jiella sonneratiae]
MDRAWIDGRPAAEADALAAAAELLERSRQPFVGGLRTDVSGIRAALGLARRIGAIVDHGESDAIYPLLTALRDGGAFLGAPAEMKRRADRVLVLGDEVAKVAPDLLAMLTETEPDLGVRTRGDAREFRSLCRAPLDSAGRGRAEHVDCAPEDIVDVVGLVRAKLSGRRAGEGAVGGDAVAGLAEFLKGAGFAAVVFAPAELGALGTEQVFGLVSDLNETTRASTLPVSASTNAMGAALQGAWTSGFPLRVGFGRGAAEHDAALFSARRQLSGDGEADLALIVDALAEPGAGGPPCALPQIAVTSEPGAVEGARVTFAVGAAGCDHDAVFYDARFGSFVGRPADAKSELPTAAAILDALADRLGGRVADAA